MGKFSFFCFFFTLLENVKFWLHIIIDIMFMYIVAILCKLSLWAQQLFGHIQFNTNLIKIN